MVVLAGSGDDWRLTWSHCIVVPMSDPPQGLREALADRHVVDREIGRRGIATVLLAQDRRTSCT
jgi:hypothetical protein